MCARPLKADRCDESLIINSFQHRMCSNHGSLGIIHPSIHLFVRLLVCLLFHPSNNIHTSIDQLIVLLRNKWTAPNQWSITLILLITDDIWWSSGLDDINRLAARASQDANSVHHNTLNTQDIYQWLLYYWSIEQMVCAEVSIGL